MSDTEKQKIRIDVHDGNIALVLYEKVFPFIEINNTKDVVIKLAELTDEKKTELAKTDSEVKAFEIMERYSKAVFGLITPSLDFDKEANDKNIGLQMLNFAAGTVYSFLAGVGGLRMYQHLESLR